MTAADTRPAPPAAFHPELTTIALPPYGTTVSAETTRAQGLVITPRIIGGRLTGGWCLTHLVSGHRVPTGHVGDVHRLHLIAAMVADLDWTDHDHGQYADDHRARIKTAVIEVEQ